MMGDYKHIIVMVHGFFGLPRCFNYSSNLLKQKLGDNTLIYISRANNHFVNGTEDGIDQAGIRLAKEITEEISKHKTLEQISFVGMSMGGLIARYAIGVLYNQENNTIAGLSPFSFVSFASPHLGVRGYVGWLNENVLSYFPFVRPSCDQFFLRDIGTNQMPLLLEMTIPESKYFLGLKLFQKRILYSNIENDHRTSYQSGAIWPYHLEKDKPFVYHSLYPCVVPHLYNNHNKDNNDNKDDNNENKNNENNENNNESIDSPSPSPSLSPPSLSSNDSSTSPPPLSFVSPSPSSLSPSSLSPFYTENSNEWKAAQNLSLLSFLRIGCHFNGWFAKTLNHSNIIVSFETMNSIGKTVVAHFVDTFCD